MDTFLNCKCNVIHKKCCFISTRRLSNRQGRFSSHTYYPCLYNKHVASRMGKCVAIDDRKAATTVIHDICWIAMNIWWYGVLGVKFNASLSRSIAFTCTTQLFNADWWWCCNVPQLYCLLNMLFHQRATYVQCFDW